MEKFKKLLDFELVNIEGGATIVANLDTLLNRTERRPKIPGRIGIILY